MPAATSATPIWAEVTSASELESAAAAPVDASLFEERVATPAAEATAPEIAEFTEPVEDLVVAEEPAV